MDTEAGPPASPAMPMNPVAAPSTYHERPRSRFLFESLLIVLSVVLGYVVTQWRERVAEEELAARVLDDVFVEVQANLEQVDAQIARHRQIAADLEAAMPGLAAAPPEQSGLQFLFNTVGGDFSGRPLRRAAWDAAVSGGALRLVDYEVAAILSDIYVAQDNVYEALLLQTNLIVFAPDTFDPERRQEVLMMMRSLLDEAIGRETLMKQKYEEYLPRLREAAARN